MSNQSLNNAFTSSEVDIREVSLREQKLRYDHRQKQWHKPDCIHGSALCADASAASASSITIIIAILNIREL